MVLEIGSGERRYHARSFVVGHTDDGASNSKLKRHQRHIDDRAWIRLDFFFTSGVCSPVVRYIAISPPLLYHLVSGSVDMRHLRFW